MNRQHAITFFLLVIWLSAYSQHTVQFSVSLLHPGNFTDSSLFIAGSFNGWNPADKNYQLKRAGNGDCYSVLKLDDGQYEFKITRGSWDKVECREGGANIPNRILKVSSDTFVRIVVEGWADKFLRKKRVSTARSGVHILDTAFLIPQLNRSRRVWLYLPPGYANSSKRFPVLYMQDGQNVFDDSTSFAGEWAVDETLDSLSGRVPGLIVVAVDNGGLKRLNEYSPYDMEKYGRGEGDLYIDFLVKTLKPFIDQNYRTLPTKENTFIVGSSMGGLISMYAVLKYPDIFGGAGIFSPAFWIAPEILEAVNQNGGRVNSRLYFYCGGKEGETMEPGMEKAFDQMRKLSGSRMISWVRPDATHTESFWREEFPLFYLWLMEK